MNKYKFLLLFILCCALPLAAAKVVLEFGWFSAGFSSKGEWLEQEVFLLPDAHQQVDHWRIAVVPALACDSPCQQALYTVRQLYTGLGRKQTQVQPVLVNAELPADYLMFESQKALVPQLDGLAGYILLIDQQGLALLRYPMPAEKSQMAPTAAAIRADLLKLLNYDRTSV
ncbi:hypothetical protein QE250_01025 [Chromatiaceae bacterium AAb-1]|nr:hypothetical protein [Chromatiaceae bacterium AAb-1]